MARSMTAYGRSHAKTSAGVFLIEVHSVNRKSLDINANLPKEFLALDMDLRSRIATDVKRGYITIRMTKETSKCSSFEIPSAESLKEIHGEWVKCARELGYDPKEAVSFSMMMQFALGSTSPTPFLDEELRKEIFKGFEKALEAFMEMKEREGKALTNDLLPRLKEIEGNVKKVGELAKLAPKRFEERLIKKLEELEINHDTDEDRLAREIVLFADRIDITEEVTRLSSHVKQFEGILQEGKKRVGRELDFLAQEMNREINTIGAKSQELEITQVILAVKSELEKIREQLANIE
jgi:uncharacterized protein (TIGR00255 family)